MFSDNTYPAVFTPYVFYSFVIKLYPPQHPLSCPVRLTSVFLHSYDKKWLLQKQQQLYTRPCLTHPLHPSVTVQIFTVKNFQCNFYTKLHEMSVNNPSTDSRSRYSGTSPSWIHFPHFSAAYRVNGLVTSYNKSVAIFLSGAKCNLRLCPDWLLPS